MGSGLPRTKSWENWGLRPSPSTVQGLTLSRSFLLPEPPKACSKGLVSLRLPQRFINVEAGFEGAARLVDLGLAGVNGSLSLVVSCLCQEEPKQNLRHTHTGLFCALWTPISCTSQFPSLESSYSRSLDQEGKLLFDSSKMTYGILGNGLVLLGFLFCLGFFVVVVYSFPFGSLGGGCHPHCK